MPASSRALRLLAPVAAVLLLSVPASAGHGPTRSGTDACNGTAAFDINNVANREVVDAVVAQNPGSRNPDGTVDRTKITHALLSASGHIVLQVREKAGAPLDRVTFEFSGTGPTWTPSSTNHPGYLTAIDAREDPARDIDSDLVVGKTFAFFIPTDVVSDGNYVARLRAFAASGAEVGRLCLDAVVSNGQGPTQAASANRDPTYEPSESTGAGVGYVPQPLLWFPAGEPTAAQQAGYGAKDLRIEFVERLGSVKVEREEVDPLDPTRKIWVDYTSRLSADDLARPHFLAGGRTDETPLEPIVGNDKVWGPGYRFPFAGLAGESLPNERLRITATDAAGKTFCGAYTFAAGANGSFLASAPSAC